MSTPEPSVSEIAAETLAVIPNARYWRHGAADGDGQRRCLLTAIYAAANNLGLDTKLDAHSLTMNPVFQAAASIIREQFPSPDVHDCAGVDTCTVIAFNDHWRTQYTDVRVVLEKLRAHTP